MRKISRTKTPGSLRTRVRAARRGSAWFYYALQNGELALHAGRDERVRRAGISTDDTDYDVSNDTPSDEAACQAIIDSHTERYTALDYTPYTELRQ